MIASVQLTSFGGLLSASVLFQPSSRWPSDSLFPNRHAIHSISCKTPRRHSRTPRIILMPQSFTPSMARSKCSLPRPRSTSRATHLPVPRLDPTKSLTMIASQKEGQAIHVFERHLRHHNCRQVILAMCHLLHLGEMRRNSSSRKGTGSTSSEHLSHGCFSILHVCYHHFLRSYILMGALVYGLGLSSPQIVSNVWGSPGSNNESSVFQTLHDNSLHTLVMVSIGTVTGGLLMIKIVKHVSPKVIQFWGFLVLFVILIVTGSAWKSLLTSNRSGLIVLYVLSHIAFNLGPNVTTFIVSHTLPSWTIAKI